MMALPKPLLRQMHLDEGSPVGIYIEGDHLIVKAQPKTSYTLQELLSQCDAAAPPTAEDEAWMSTPATGNEIL